MPSPVLSEPAVSDTSREPALAPRAGGLLHLPKGFMTPVFTVFMTLLYVEVLLLVFMPFMLAHGKESPWAEAPRLGFLAVAVLSSMVFGLLASVVAERRGHSAWWFLAGQGGAMAAPILAATGMAESSPFWARFIVFAAGLVGTLVCFVVVGAARGGKAAVFPPPASPAAPRPKGNSKAVAAAQVAALSPFTRGLSRAWHATGNIWYGISLLVLLIVAIVIGSNWENRYGAKSANAVVYSGWWFGLLFLVFSASLIAATLRKYPFRLDQAGWLATHLGLITIIVGMFMSFWGKVDGELALKEGQSSSVFDVSTQTRIKVETFRHDGSNRGRWQPLWEEIADFDLDPKQREIEREYIVRLNDRELFPITVDRYYADTELERVHSNRGSQPRAALFATARMPNGAQQTLELVEGDPRRTSQNLSFLRMSLYPLGNPLMAEALQGGRDTDNHGKLAVKDGNGNLLLEVPVEPGPRPEGSRDAPASLAALDVEIPGTGGVRLKGVSWFSRIQIDERTHRPVDLAPGRPAFPAAIVELDGPEGKESRTAIAFLPELSSDPRALKTYEDIHVFLDYIPRYPLARSELACVFPQQGDPFWVMDFSDGERRSGPIRAGEALDLGIPLTITVEEVFDRYVEDEEVKFAAFNPQHQAIRVQVPDDRTEGVDDERWVFLGGASGMFEHDGERYRLRWAKTQHPLGFNLHLRDFHRDFYPGTENEKTFESHLWLTHDTKFPDRTPIKIDMNHPLRLDGWRLYQSRFAIAGDETTFLQVNRDPGLVLIYPACIILTLGLVIVFFQKPFLRAVKRWLERRGARGEIHFLAAVAVVAGAFLSTLPGVLVISLIPEGPAQGLGALMMVLGLVLETCLVNFFLKRRMESSSTPAAPSAGAAT